MPQLLQSPHRRRSQRARTFHTIYDGNDNLARVIQSDGTTAQERRFKYDSLSRLTHEKQVEASATLDINGIKGTADPTTKWTKYLKYNPDGLLDYGVDARGVKTTFGYDGLNRVQSVVYTGETGYQTPAVTYTYDQARSGYFNTGALTRVETAAVGDNPSTATEFDFDAMGRVRKHRQYIGTQEYDLEYTYNLAGQLTSEKYPSGKVATNSYDANGRLSGITDAQRTYLSGMQYLGKGNSMSAMTFGNGTVQTFTMNDRLQMAGQELKRGSEVLQKYDYTFGELDSQQVLKNNGKLESVVSHIGAAKQWAQKFKYDAIGRLSESSELRGDTDALSYKQKFDFDRFGNLYRKVASNPTAGQETPLAFTPIEDADISKANNRFATNTTYDDAGNVVTDNKFRSMNFSYDANGRMVGATRETVPDATSVYDASGMRVGERVNDVWRFLVYDAGGKLVAEYGGLQSTDDGGVKYVLSDWQGSTRATISGTGFVKSRSDYTAFGEEINSGTGLRTATQGFGTANDLRQKYGLTERDDGTGLDHTWFRKNENQAGRWTSLDPYNGSMSLDDPQSFNRYSYVENQPTNFVDPSGLNMVFVICYDVVTDGHYRDNPSSNYVHTEHHCVSFGVGDSVGGTFDPGVGDGGGGSPQHFPECVQNAIVKYYESVGNSSADRMKKVASVAAGANYSTNGFPALSPPTLGGFVGRKIRAYTQSNLVHFNHNEYEPATANGMALIIHEFTHLMQFAEYNDFSMHYVKEWMRNGDGDKNVYEHRAYINGAKAETFFNNNPNLLCK